MNKDLCVQSGLVKSEHLPNENQSINEVAESVQLMNEDNVASNIAQLNNFTNIQRDAYLLRSAIQDHLADNDINQDENIDDRDNEMLYDDEVSSVGNSETTAHEHDSDFKIDEEDAVRTELQDYEEDIADMPTIRINTNRRKRRQPLKKKRSSYNYYNNYQDGVFLEVLQNNDNFEQLLKHSLTDTDREYLKTFMIENYATDKDRYQHQHFVHESKFEEWCQDSCQVLKKVLFGDEERELFFDTWKVSQKATTTLIVDENDPYFPFGSNLNLGLIYNWIRGKISAPSINMVLSLLDKDNMLKEDWKCKTPTDILVLLSVVGACFVHKPAIILKMKISAAKANQKLIKQIETAYIPITYHLDDIISSRTMNYVFKKYSEYKDNLRRELFQPLLSGQKDDDVLPGNSWLSQMEGTHPFWFRIGLYLPITLSIDNEDLHCAIVPGIIVSKSNIYSETEYLLVENIILDALFVNVSKDPSQFQIIKFTTPLTEELMGKKKWQIFWETLQQNPNIYPYFRLIGSTVYPINTTNINDGMYINSKQTSHDSKIWEITTELNIGYQYMLYHACLDDNTPHRLTNTVPVAFENGYKLKTLKINYINVNNTQSSLENSYYFKNFLHEWESDVIHDRSNVPSEVYSFGVQLTYDDVVHHHSLSMNPSLYQLCFNMQNFHSMHTHLLALGYAKRNIQKLWDLFNYEMTCLGTLGRITNGFARDSLTPQPCFYTASCVSQLADRPAFQEMLRDNGHNGIQNKLHTIWSRTSTKIYQQNIDLWSIKYLKNEQYVRMIRKIRQTVKMSKHKQLITKCSGVNNDDTISFMPMIHSQTISNIDQAHTTANPLSALTSMLMNEMIDGNDGREWLLTLYFHLFHQQIKIKYATQGSMAQAQSTKETLAFKMTKISIYELLQFIKYWLFSFDQLSNVVEALNNLNCLIQRLDCGTWNNFERKRCLILLNEIIRLLEECNYKRKWADRKHRVNISMEEKRKQYFKHMRKQYGHLIDEEKLNNSWEIERDKIEKNEKAKENKRNNNTPLAPTSGDFDTFESFLTNPSLSMFWEFLSIQMIKTSPNLCNMNKVDEINKEMKSITSSCNAKNGKHLKHSVMRYLQLQCIRNLMMGSGFGSNNESYKGKNLTNIEAFDYVDQYTQRKGILNYQNELLNCGYYRIKDKSMITDSSWRNYFENYFEAIDKMENYEQTNGDPHLLPQLMQQYKNKLSMVYIHLMVRYLAQKLLDMKTHEYIGENDNDEIKYTNLVSGTILDETQQEYFYTQITKGLQNGKLKVSPVLYVYFQVGLATDSSAASTHYGWLYDKYCKNFDVLKYVELVHFHGLQNIVPQLWNEDKPAVFVLGKKLKHLFNYQWEHGHILNFRFTIEHGTVVPTFQQTNEFKIYHIASHIQILGPQIVHKKIDDDLLRTFRAKYPEKDYQSCYFMNNDKNNVSDPGCCIAYICPTCKEIKCESRPDCPKINYKNKPDASCFKLLCNHTIGEDTEVLHLASIYQGFNPREHEAKHIGDVAVSN